MHDTEPEAEGKGPAASGADGGAAAQRVDPVPAVCLAGFLALWTFVAIAPAYRLVWALENFLTVLLVAVLVVTYRRFRLSRRAYVQVTLFLALHTLATRSSYAEAPIGAWIRDALGLDRNPYDRIAHFAFGLLMLRPLRELASRSGARAAARFEIAVALLAVGSAAMVYELLEWGVAALAVTKLGARVKDAAPAAVAFLASQHDAWDAQKDMALACLGAMVAILAEPRGRLPRGARRP
ncbi:MAG: DUF2238 domain-containing protein [Polyangiaceae bacterium]|nr:DUF2238 domain-containing protein [Polyangiaceae bacterium]